MRRTRLTAVCAAAALCASGAAGLDAQEKKPSEPFDSARVPEPVFDDNPGYVDLYWKAWKLAWNHVHTDKGAPRSPFMDEGRANDTISLWESCFMALFTKYAPETFPGIQSLDNFYAVMYDDEESSQTVEEPGNPPLFAWAEWEHFKMTGDTARLKRVLTDKQYLQKHYEFFQSRYGRGEWYGFIKGYLRTPKEAGMINTPRVRFFDNHKMFWLDAFGQQMLSTLCITRLADAIGDSAVAREYRDEYATFKGMLLDVYFQEQPRVSHSDFFDINTDDIYNKVFMRTPAMFWPLLAEGADSAAAASAADNVKREGILGGAAPFPSVSRGDIDFDPTGGYWKGSVFVPIVYMSIKALEKYGYTDLADETARRMVHYMYKTFEEYEPHTIWEAYSPTEYAPATGVDGKTLVRKNYCGWSALGPISMFIEHVLGFHDIDAHNAAVHWRLQWPKKHGIKRLSFGDITTDIMYDQGTVTVGSNASYSLVINGEAHDIDSGTTRIEVETPGERDSLSVPEPYPPIGTGIRIEGEDGGGNISVRPGEHDCFCSGDWAGGIGFRPCFFDSVPPGEKLIIRYRGTLYGKWGTNIEMKINDGPAMYLDFTTFEWEYMVLEDVGLTREYNTIELHGNIGAYPFIDFIEVVGTGNPAIPRAGNEPAHRGAGLSFHEGGLRYYVPSRQNVRIDLMSLSGRKVACVVNEVKPAEAYRVPMQRVVPSGSGLYLFRMQTQDGSRVLYRIFAGERTPSD